MHKEIRTPSEAAIRHSEHLLKLAKEARALRREIHRQEKAWRKEALSLLEIPIVKLP